METFETIREKGLLLFEYIRGSHAYGLNIETSDVDTSAIYVCPKDEIYGIGLNYKDMIADEKGDTTWYEVGKYMKMLIKSNPTVIESLFVDEKFILFEHPLFAEIRKHRQEFITKDCFDAFVGYAYGQIKKARGLNKKIVMQHVKQHLHPLDFCFTFYNQGSTPIQRWLTNRGLKQKYCGLVNIPNMHNTYGVYYDFGNHMLHEEWITDKKFIKFAIGYYKPNWLIRHSLSWSISYLMQKCKGIGYRGIVGEQDNINIENITNAPKIFDLRLSPIDNKLTKPICYMTYNSSGYTDHCIKYKEYQEWVEKRNLARFNENKESEFDRKNMAHCVRLLHMGIEIATKGEVHVNRKNIDRDFILNIRLGNTSYDEIIKYVEDKMVEMKDAMAKSTLPEHIDTDMVDKLLIKIRNEFKI